MPGIIKDKELQSMFSSSFKIISLISVFCLFVCNPSSGQEKKPSSEFIYHSVEKKETIYSIARENEVSPEDIYQYNPGSKDGIKTGQVLQIPKKDKSQKSNQSPKEILYKVGKGESLYFIAKKFNCTQEDILKLNPALSSSPIGKGVILRVPNPEYISKPEPPAKSLDGFMSYKIQSGDTYYNLKKRFGTEKEELEKLNPELKNGLKEGLSIKIPKKELPNANQSGKDLQQKDDKLTEQTDKIPEKKGNNHLFNVGLFLPFCCDQNDSSKITPQTANYLEFYEGAMIAAEKLSNEMKVKLFVYDTNQDPKVVEQLVKKPEFLSLDLIIGPVYPECQKIVSELSGKNHIPMVSPLSPDSRFVSGNPNYYQINPDKKLRLSGTAEYIIKEFQGKNIILLGNESETGILPEKLRQKIKPGDFRLYDLWADDRSGVENQLNPDKENVIVLTEPDEAKVSVAITRLNTVVKKFRITLIGLQEYTRMQSINTEYLHNLNLHYLSPYFIDYSNKNVRGFIEKFRSDFSAEPTPYAFQGFDVMSGFLNSLRKSGRKFVPAPSALLQADYNFQRVSTFGGFVNTTFFILEYTDSFEIHSVGKISP